MNTLTVPASVDYLDRVIEFINNELEAYDCPMKAQMQLELAVEEIFVNIASYAYNPVEGEAEVRCEVLTDPLRVVIQFLDGGKPFDPLAKEEYDTSPEAFDDTKVGGLGIYMTRKTMDEVQYAYENGKNILTIRKELQEGAGAGNET